MIESVAGYFGMTPTRLSVYALAAAWLAVYGIVVMVLRLSARFPASEGENRK